MGNARSRSGENRQPPAGSWQGTRLPGVSGGVGDQRGGPAARASASATESPSIPWGPAPAGGVSFPRELRRTEEILRRGREEWPVKAPPSPPPRRASRRGEENEGSPVASSAPRPCARTVQRPRRRSGGDESTEIRWPTRSNERRRVAARRRRTPRPTRRPGSKRRSLSGGRRSSRAGRGPSRRPRNDLALPGPIVTFGSGGAGRRPTASPSPLPTRRAKGDRRFSRPRSASRRPGTLDWPHSRNWSSEAVCRCRSRVSATRPRQARHA